MARRVHLSTVGRSRLGDKAHGELRMLSKEGRPVGVWNSFRGWGSRRGS